MACCLICFKDDPVEDSKLSAYYGNPNQFQIGMNVACCKEPCWCLAGGLCSCCTTCYIRRRLLEGNMDNYTCCQGYLAGCCCCKPGHMGEKTCPSLCLCLESFCCLSCGVSANRMYIMDKYRLTPDPWDNRIIRFNNCMQLLSCICNILAMIDNSFYDLARIIDLIAEIVFYTTVGCMNAQMMHELDYQESAAPKAQEIAR